MKSGYKILWTNNALKELKQTYSYLETHWTERELKRLTKELEVTLNLISTNPNLFQMSAQKGIRRVVIRKFNTLYYKVNELNKTIEILSFFSNRQNSNMIVYH